MIILDGNHLNLKDFNRVVNDFEKAAIAEDSIERVHRSRQIVDDIVSHKKSVYGVNTGFGKLCDEKISCDALNQLQVNLLRSHACGVGKPFDIEIVRGMMLLRINALIKGYSGIRLETVEKLLEMLNKNVIPVVYEKGSLGASGDLVPLAHMSLPLIGEGEVIYQRKRMPTEEAFDLAGIKPLDDLWAKEGLALINGTQAMTSVACIALNEAYTLLHSATTSSAFTLEALEGIMNAFDERVHEVRNQEGQIIIAKVLRDLLKDSRNVASQCEERVQDAYSLRCIPQVHGATLDTLDYVKGIVEREMNAVTDNPIVFDNEEAISAGNFHGQPIALVMDYLAIAVSELANIAERRIERLVNPSLNGDLPAFLAKKRGLHSGFMIVQYAAASLVSENKILCHPASVDSIPSSANQEDHVSMGTIAARKALKVIEHTRHVIGLEFMTAAQAIGFKDEKKLSPILKTIYSAFRKEVPFIEEDTVMHQYMEISAQWIKDKKLLRGDLDV